MGIIDLRQCRLAESREHFSQAHALAQAHDDQFLSTWATMWLGVLAKNAGEYHAAEQLFGACVAAWQARNFPRGEAVVLTQLSEIACSHEQLDTALDHSRAALHIASVARDVLGISMALTVLGKLARARGTLDEARYVLSESVAGMRELGDGWLMGRALSQLAQVEVERGDDMAAMRACAEIVRLAAAGEVLLIAEAAYSLALPCERTGDVHEAFALLSALKGAVGEADTLRRAAAMREALSARLALEEHARAAAQAHERPLVEWLGDICGRWSKAH